MKRVQLTGIALMLFFLAGTVVAETIEVPAILYFPEKLTFWNVEPKGVYEKEIQFRQNDEYRFEIIRIRNSNPQVTVKVSSSGGKEHLTYRLSVTLMVTQEEDVIHDEIIVETTHPYTPEIVIPVSGNVLKGVTLNPPTFGVSMNVFKRLAYGAVQVRSTENKPFKILDVSASFSGIKTEVTPMEECCGYFIAVAIADPERKINKPTQATLHIKTDSEQGMIVVPVLINVPPTH